MGHYASVLRRRENRPMLAPLSPCRDRAALAVVGALGPRVAFCCTQITRGAFPRATERAVDLENINIGDSKRPRA